MAKVRPSQEPERVELEFKYDVSDEYVEDHVLKTGLKPAKRWILSVDLTEVDDPALRAELRRAHRIYYHAPWYPSLPAPTDDPLLVVGAIFARHASTDSWTAEPYEQAMREWVSEYGSRRLRRAVAGGYEATRLYVLERSRVELPGFWPDLGGKAEWTTRANPTEDALDLEEAVARDLDRVYPEEHGYRPRIVWLKKPPRDLDEALDAVIYPDEAILLAPWLGRHAMLLPLDPDLRRAGEEAS